MSLARAMTKRMKRSAAPENIPAVPSRSNSLRNPSLQIDRAQISLPVALLSTTNQLVYDAPDIANMDLTAIQNRNVSSSTVSTQSSADDSDHSVSGRSRASSNGSRDTDASSVESSPTSPAPNHLSGYFPAQNGKTLRKASSTTSLTTSLKQVKEEPIEQVPALPTRALSHSKRAHVQLAQKRSMQNLSISSRGSLGSLREQRSSLDIFNTAIAEEESAPPHPFGAELEQLNEVAEEFSGVARSAEEEADLVAMRSRNLASFCAADYLSEIQPLWRDLVAPRMAWI